MSSGRGLVYPSLPLWAARDRYEKLRDDQRDPALLRGETGFDDPAATWYPTGPRVRQVQLSQLQQVMRQVADEVGFPHSSKAAFREFDQRAAGPLHRTMAISPARAGDSGVWAFLSLVLLPDIAVWRYSERHPERLMGGHRNVLQRLWLRAEVLGGAPGDPPARLGEDQLVAIMERPDSLGRDARVARALARELLQFLDRRSSSGMLLMRDAAKRASRLSAWLLLGSLDDAALGRVMARLVEDAARSLRDGAET